MGRSALNMTWRDPTLLSLSSTSLDRMRALVTRELGWLDTWTGVVGRGCNCCWT